MRMKYHERNGLLRYRAQYLIDWNWLRDAILVLTIPIKATEIY